VLCLAAAGLAQPAKDSAAPSVLNHIPAGSLGFFVVNNVKATTDAVDKYLAEIGVDKMLKKEMPKGLLTKIRADAKLGEGFNPNAGFALILLDPKPFGMDVMQMFGGRVPEPGPDGAPPPERPEPPVVMLVPGKDVKSIFGQYELAAAGPYTKVKIKKDAYASKLGDHVAISPSLKALEAVVKSKESVVSKLSSTETGMIGASAGALHLNMEILGPPLLKMLKAQMQAQGAGMGPGGAILKAMMSTSGGALKDFAGMTVAARFTKSGVLLETFSTVKPTSPYAKLLKPRAAGASVLAKVPNLKYVLALGTAPSDPEAVPEAAKPPAGMVGWLLKLATEGKITDAQIAKVTKPLAALGKQVKAIQLVGGGPAGDAGLFGLSLVIDCKDITKVKAALSEGANALEGVIKETGGEDAKGLKIAYQKGVEMVGTTPVDAITVSHPELAEMGEEDRAEMKKVLGEDKFRILLAAADDNTLVLTFGGSSAMMAKALATAKASNGTVLQAPGTAEATQHMPKRPEMLLLVNAGNFADLMLSAMKKMDPEEEAVLPFKLSCKVPLAIGVGVKKNAAHMAIYVPNKLVKEIAELAMTVLGGEMEGPVAEPQVPGGDDF
jgi:hypothetical protein